MTNDVATPLIEHLTELASRLKIILYSLLVTTSIFMVIPANLSSLKQPLAFYNPLIALVLKQITNDVLPSQVQLIAGEFTAPLEIYLIASLLMGIVTSSPIIAYEIYQYVNPALYDEERKAVYPFVITFTALFITGSLFGYKILAPFMLWAMIPFFTLTGAAPIIHVMDFYNLVFITVLVSGFSFTMPVFFLLLVKFGIIKTSYVTTRRKYIYAALYIVCAVVTPDGGPIADIALFLPMLILLEVAVYFGKRIESNRGPTVPKPSARKLVYLKCKFCGELIDSKSSFCPGCGKAQS